MRNFKFGLIFLVLVAAVALTFSLNALAQTNPAGSPKGAITSATCDQITGWTCDPDRNNTALSYMIYDGNSAIGIPHIANTQIVNSFGLCGGNYVQSFGINTPAVFKDGNTHNLNVYGINIAGTPGQDALLTNSPTPITCVTYKPDILATDVAPIVGPVIGVYNNISANFTLGYGVQKYVTALLQKADDINGTNPVDVSTGQSWIDSNFLDHRVQGFSIPLPSYTFTSTSTYYFRTCVDKSAKADVSGVVDESNENNNCTSWYAATVRAPDLVASAISKMPSIYVNAPTTLSSNVTNQGTLDISSGNPLTTLFQKADDAIGTNAADIGTSVNNNPVLLMNDFKTFNFSYTFTNVGTYYIRACADKSTAQNGGNFTELNEGNNCGAWTAVTVTNPPPTLTFTAAPSSIPTGNSSTLTWSSSNTTICNADSPSWTNSTAISGTQNVSPTVTTTYSITCTGQGGSITKTATVTVSALPVNGVCATTHYVCTSGNSVPGTDTATKYVWSCTGINGGTDSQPCNENKTQPIGDFDYSLSVGAANMQSGHLVVAKNPSPSQTVTGDVSIIKTLLSGNAEEVTLSAINLPAGISVTHILNNPSYPNINQGINYDSNIALTIDSSVQPSTYTITINGLSTSGLNRTTTFSLMVNPPAACPADKVLDANGQCVCPVGQVLNGNGICTTLYYCHDAQGGNMGPSQGNINGVVCPNSVSTFPTNDNTYWTYVSSCPQTPTACKYYCPANTNWNGTICEPIVGLPDLTSTDFVTPTSVIAGSPVQFSGIIKNIGTGPIPNGTQFVSTFQLADSYNSQTGNVSLNTVGDAAPDGLIGGQRWDNGMLSGDSQAIVAQKSWTPSVEDIGKTKYVRLCADTAKVMWDEKGDWFNRIKESNESNNCSPWTTITILDVNQPINGVCSTTHFNCSAGTNLESSDLETTSGYSWTCKGVNNGTDANCLETKTVLPPGDCPVGSPTPEMCAAKGQT